MIDWKLTDEEAAFLVKCLGHYVDCLGEGSVGPIDEDRCDKELRFGDNLFEKVMGHKYFREVPEPAP